MVLVCTSCQVKQLATAAEYAKLRATPSSLSMPLGDRVAIRCARCVALCIHEAHKDYRYFRCWCRRCSGYIMAPIAERLTSPTHHCFGVDPPPMVELSARASTQPTYQMPNDRLQETDMSEFKLPAMMPAKTLFDIADEEDTEPGKRKPKPGKGPR